MSERFTIYENGKKLTTSTDWKKTVKGLNTAQDIIDADYQEITVKRLGRTVYHQPRTRVP